MVDGLKYAKDHEWVKVEGDVATVGITDHAQVRGRGPRRSSIARGGTCTLHKPALAC